jgi:FkbM family methyltransferase
VAADVPIEILQFPPTFVLPQKRGFLRQLLDCPALLKFVSGRKLAIDGGAHIGTWSLLLSRVFTSVLAFEPAPDTADALGKNMQHCPNVTVHRKALGDAACHCDIPNMQQPAISRYVEKSPSGAVEMLTIDSLALDACDLIKLDLEGYELPALRGAAETIAKFRPPIIVERGLGKDPHEWLRNHAYRLKFVARPNFLYLPTAEGP